MQRLGQEATAGKRIINDIALRARYLDDQILQHLQQAASSSGDGGSSSSPAGAGAITQQASAGEGSALTDQASGWYGMD